jgi:hypothetical protein
MMLSTSSSRYSSALCSRILMWNFFGRGCYFESFTSSWNMPVICVIFE